MSGHVFACRADLTRLACDAWLLPAGTDGRVQALDPAKLRGN